LMNKIKNDEKAVIVLVTSNEHGMAEQRRFFFMLIENNIRNPVIIKRSYKNLNINDLRLYSSTDIGALLIDGLGDGVWMNVENISELGESDDLYVKSFIKKRESTTSLINRTLFGILQAARVRISKTEYIACPSCGRTLFDLQETTDMIRKRTEHLTGVKIAIMGCIVNGPGEMADADYGFVGSGVDKITLYRGKDIVRRNISAKFAVNSLIEIIKEDNIWVEPKGNA
jgi:(E)-4-hydroxy-3-methylbut-2-enyl-diphosphate synthase